MSQMVVQAMWDRDSPLLQIPYFDTKIVDTLAQRGIKDIDDFMTAMDPNENPDHAKLAAAIGLTNRQLVDAANFTNNKYPSLELDFEVEDNDAVTAGQPSYLQVRITREVDEDADEEGGEVDLTVHAPFYPSRKLENWWLVVAEEKTKSLLAIKRITVAKALATKLEYVVPTAGKKDLTLFLMSDSYVGVDQSMAFSVDVAEGMDEDEEEEEGDEE
jgi:pre-mRNA-splicing helicase BRR2